MGNKSKLKTNAGLELRNMGRYFIASESFSQKKSRAP